MSCLSRRCFRRSVGVILGWEDEAARGRGAVEKADAAVFVEIGRGGMAGGGAEIGHGGDRRGAQEAGGQVMQAEAVGGRRVLEMVQEAARAVAARAEASLVEEATGMGRPAAATATEEQVEQVAATAAGDSRRTGPAILHHWAGRSTSGTAAPARRRWL